nr:MAG TPA: acid phosphatase [Caudoviricetes sp.]
MLDYFRLRGAKVIFISSLNREILNEILIASSFLPFFNVPMSLPLS